MAEKASNGYRRALRAARLAAEAKKPPRAAWKNHRWDFDARALQATCRRCGCVEMFTIRVRGDREWYRSAGFVVKGGRIAYERAPRCLVLPAGMTRIG